MTKTLVSFRRWDRVKDEKFQYYGSSPIFRGRRGGFTKKKTIYRGNFLKKGFFSKKGEGLTGFQFLERGC